jgi:hypothetical protein
MLGVASDYPIGNFGKFVLVSDGQTTDLKRCSDVVDLEVIQQTTEYF